MVDYFKKNKDLVNYFNMSQNELNYFLSKPM